ncbi:MAG: peptide ABC transporter permease [Chloroflexi bacterium]|nr:MAG: peptide ABC transporter permease [Chloroflexota bacterium]
MKRRSRWNLLVLLSPAYLWLLLFGFAPLGIMLYFSFLSDTPLSGRTVHFTFDNYLRYFTRGFYSQLTGRSLLMGFYTTVGCLILGYPLAYALAKRVQGRWQTVLFLLIIVPFWSNSLIRLYSWIIVLSRGGIINYTLARLGWQVEFGVLFTYPAIIIGLVHAYLPYMVLTIYVALDRIDDRLVEAAASLGARPWRTFLRVVLPLSMPGVVAGVILVFIPAIGSFVEPRLLGGPAGTMLGTVIEDQFVQVFNWPLGAALSFILLLIVAAILALSARLLTQRTQL